MKKSKYRAQKYINFVIPFHYDFSCVLLNLFIGKVMNIHCGRRNFRISNFIHIHWDLYTRLAQSDEVNVNLLHDGDDED